MRERIAAYLLLVSMLLSASLMILPHGSAELIEGRYIPIDEMGVEVLLNSPDTSYDPLRLDELVEEGVIRVLEGGGSSGGTWSADPFGPDRYLMRNPLDERIGVVIQHVDNTAHLEEFALDHPLAGLSISLVLPGTLELAELNYSVYEVDLQDVHLDIDTLEDDLVALGFKDMGMIRINDTVTIFSSYGNDEQIVLRVSSSFPDNDTYEVGVQVEIIDEFMNNTFLEQFSSLLRFLDVGSDDPVDHLTDAGSRYINLVKPTGGIDPEDMDWKAAMGSQLEWMLSEGIISGLSGQDVRDISELSIPGHFGYLWRIIYHYPSEDWMIYNETGLPMNWLNFGGVAETYPDDLFPASFGSTHAESNGPDLSVVIPLIAVSLILIPLGSLLIYRSKRAVDINNARRRLIYDTISDNPGIHFRAIMDRLDLKPGVTSYHVNRLEKMELIKSFQDGMYRKFYLYDDKVEMKVTLSDLQSLIVNVIQEEPGISQIDISRSIGKSKVVVNYHVKFLKDLGLLVVERDGRSTHCFLTSAGKDLGAC